MFLDMHTIATRLLVWSFFPHSLPLLRAGVGVSVLDDGVNPVNDLIMPSNARLFIDGMLSNQFRTLSVRVKWTYRSKASSAWSGHEPINVLGEVVVHLAIGIPAS
jgi:hypothetical protein